MNKTKAYKIIAEFEKEHNHSWYEELYRRNKDTLDDTALYYRGNCISYKSMFERMRQLAGALQTSGVRKGTEIPVCLSNSPELIYVMGAASILGAVINVFSASFPLDYITEIINGCDDCIGIFEDNHFIKIQSAVESSHLKNYILCSLADSLPSETLDTDEIIGHEYVNFSSKVKALTANCSKAVWFYDFITRPENTLELNDKIVLDDDFTVTYTSGSTNALRPKAIVQRVRSFCVIGRFHDADVMHGMHFKNIRGLAIIPPHSNTDLISGISDTLMQGAVLSIEPVYNEMFFLDSILFNKPNFVTASRSFWMTAMKQLLYDDRYRGKKMPFLLLVFAVGEELHANEERLLNKALVKADAGKDYHHLPFSPICFCVAGGDCEHGSILYQLFRAVTNHTFSSSAEKRYGMVPFDFVDVAVLDHDGNKLGPDQLGRLVANSPCTMRCYKNDPEATKAFFITDADGNIWGDMSVYGYMDKRGKVYMRNRILDDGQSIPPFMIADEILKSKAFLSCEVVHVNDKYIAHVEFIPDTVQNIDRELRNAKLRCQKAFDNAVTDNLMFKLHEGMNSFTLTASGKRDIKYLISEGATDAFYV